MSPPVEVREIARDSREIVVGRTLALLVVGAVVGLLSWLLFV
jgi:hypothetical protein